MTIANAASSGYGCVNLRTLICAVGHELVGAASHAGLVESNCRSIGVQARGKTATAAKVYFVAAFRRAAQYFFIRSRTALR